MCQETFPWERVEFQYLLHCTLKAERYNPVYEIRNMRGVYSWSLCLCRESCVYVEQEEEVWMSSSSAPYRVLRQDPLVHCEGRTILEVPFISVFSSSFCFPRKKSQNPSSISLPVNSQGWLGPHTEHILPPIAVDTSFCVPFNQLITISHNPLYTPQLRCLHYPHYHYYRYVLFKGTFLSILCDLD